MKAFFSPSLSKIIFVRGALRTRRVQNAFPRGAWERESLSKILSVRALVEKFFPFVVSLSNHEKARNKLFFLHGLIFKTSHKPAVLLANRFKPLF